MPERKRFFFIVAFPKEKWETICWQGENEKHVLKSGTRHPPRPDGVPPNLFKLSKTYWLVSSIANICHNRTTGGGVLFSSRCTFFHRQHWRYCFMKVYSENITHKIPYTPTKKPSTPTKIPRKKPSTPTKYWVRQPKYQVRQAKYQVCQPKIYAVLSRGNFCRKFTHFWA